MSGTDLPYGALPGSPQHHQGSKHMRCPVLIYSVSTRTGIAYRSGTDMACRASLRACYAMSGTRIAYLPTRLLRDVRY
eukprot:2010322-Rhodomonas_salina.1